MSDFSSQSLSTRLTASNRMLTDDEGKLVTTALMVAAIFACVLFAVLILRYLYKFLADKMKAQDDNFVRCVTQRLCPFWHPASSIQPAPEGHGTDMLSRSDVCVKQLLESLPLDQRKKVFEQILPRKVLTAQNLRYTCVPGSKSSSKCVDDDVMFELEAGQATQRAVADDTSALVPSQNGLDPLCSICLHELQLGDCIVTSKCNHVFHHLCIAEWVACNAGIECPYCRAELLTVADIDQVKGSGTTTAANLLR